jgi:hypothetical protein
MRTALVALLLVTGLPAVARAECAAGAQSASVDELVRRVRSEGLRYVFVGERHGVGPVKRFAVELANALAADGIETGLYVEGFRSSCDVGDETCWSLAWAFNAGAFGALLDQARVPVHPIDPPSRERRVERMAAAIAAGDEAVRVVLAGKTHVVHADDPDADWRVFGGLRYPSPGDLARAFERSEYVTVGLEVVPERTFPYRLTRGGCGVDYQLATSDVADYWGGGRGGGAGGPRPTRAAPR